MKPWFLRIFMKPWFHSPCMENNTCGETFRARGSGPHSVGRRQVKAGGPLIGMNVIRRGGTFSILPARTGQGHTTHVYHHVPVACYEHRAAAPWPSPATITSLDKLHLRVFLRKLAITEKKRCVLSSLSNKQTFKGRVCCMF